MLWGYWTVFVNGKVVFFESDHFASFFFFGKCLRDQDHALVVGQFSRGTHELKSFQFKTNCIIAKSVNTRWWWSSRRHQFPGTLCGRYTAALIFLLTSLQFAQISSFAQQTLLADTKVTSLFFSLTKRETAHLKVQESHSLLSSAIN